MRWCVLFELTSSMYHSCWVRVGDECTRTRYELHRGTLVLVEELSSCGIVVAFSWNEPTLWCFRLLVLLQSYAESMYHTYFVEGMISYILVRAYQFRKGGDKSAPVDTFAPGGTLVYPRNWGKAILACTRKWGNIRLKCPRNVHHAIARDGGGRWGTAVLPQYTWS